MLSTLDRYWKKNLSLEDGLDVIRKCIAEVQKRLVISQPRFSIKMVSKDGIKVIDAADLTTPGVKSSDEKMSTEAAPVSA